MTDEWLDFDETEYYEEQGCYQKLKHNFIETYLKIWAINVGYNSKKIVPFVDFIDLYAASGWAKCEGKEPWHGSALIATKMFGEYSKGHLLILNSYDQDRDKCLKNLQILEKSVNKLVKEDFPHISKKIRYFSHPIEEAANSALKIFDRNYPSVWILDPYAPSQLPWKIVEKIALATGGFSRKGKWEEKKPEIIINLMTSVLQRFSELHQETVQIGYDMSLEEWTEKIDYFEKIWKRRGVKKSKLYVVLDIYLEKLSNLYKNPPLVILVQSEYGQIVYAMIHCTDNDAGHQLMKKKLSEDYEQYKIYEWTKKDGLKKIKPKKQRTLDSFF